MLPQTGSSTIAKGKPVQFYYGTASFQHLTYPFQFEQNWAEFFGALLSASFMPDEQHPLFHKLESAAQETFTLTDHVSTPPLPLPKMQATRKLHHILERGKTLRLTTVNSQLLPSSLADS
jgi:hypothetical protein